MVTAIKDTKTKTKRTNRTAERAKVTQGGYAAKAPRKRLSAVEKSGVEDAAYAKVHHDEKKPTKTSQAHQGLGQFMTRGKDLVSGDVASVAAAAAIVVGAALIEVELIPGLVIGAGAILLGKVFPELGSYVRPALKGAIRAGFFMTQKAREVMAETTEQMHDLVAEVVTEQGKTRAAKEKSPVAGSAHYEQPTS